MAENPNIQAQIAALADGSLSAEKREQLTARLKESNELTQAFEIQQRAVDLVRNVDVVAPVAVHHRAKTLLSGRARATHPRTPRLAILGALLSALTAVVIIAVASLGGSSPTPTLREIAALTVSPATIAAPEESSANHAELAVSVQGVAFPYWDERFHWRATGTRIDRIRGRQVTTVFYEDERGRRIGYSILAGAPVTVSGGTLITRRQVSYRLLKQNSVPVVSWLRDGHLCVISGPHISSRTLVRLASWSEDKTLV